MAKNPYPAKQPTNKSKGRSRGRGKVAQMAAKPRKSAKVAKPDPTPVAEVDTTEAKPSSGRAHPPKKPAVMSDAILARLEQLEKLAIIHGWQIVLPGEPLAESGE